MITIGWQVALCFNLKQNPALGASLGGAYDRLSQPRKCEAKSVYQIIFPPITKHDFRKYNSNMRIIDTVTVMQSLHNLPKVKVHNGLALFALKGLDHFEDLFI